jgi:hypothetical protein
MKTILIMSVILTLCQAKEPDFQFVKAVDEGFEIKSNVSKAVFVYNSSSCNFRVLTNLGVKPYKTTMEEAGKDYELQNHTQAAESVTHGRFLISQQRFIIAYPPGYTRKNFPKKVFLEIVYRYVSEEDEGLLHLSKINKIEIEVSEDMSAGTGSN